MAAIEKETEEARVNIATFQMVLMFLKENPLDKKNGSLLDEAAYTSLKEGAIKGMRKELETLVFLREAYITTNLQTAFQKV